MTTIAEQDNSMTLTGRAMHLGPPETLWRLVRTWQQRRRSAAADRQLWNTALSDPRIMAEITRAQDAHPGDVRKHRMMRTF